MTPLHVRLITILRNLKRPATAADIRAKCQLPQDLELIHHALGELCDTGRAVQTDIGLFAHRDYEQPPGMPEPLVADEGRDLPEGCQLPPAVVDEPPDDDAAACTDQPPSESPPSEDIPRMTKTDQVLQVLRTHAPAWDRALTCEQISVLLDGRFDAGKVSAILCSRRTAGNTPELASRSNDGKRLEWVWIEGGADEPAEPDDGAPGVDEAAEPSAVAASDQAALAAEFDDVPRLADGRGEDVFVALEQMAAQMQARPVRDLAIKVAAIEGVAKLAPPALAIVLRRVVAEDLFRSEA